MWTAKCVFLCMGRMPKTITVSKVLTFTVNPKMKHAPKFAVVFSSWLVINREHRTSKDILFLVDSSVRPCIDIYWQHQCFLCSAPPFLLTITFPIRNHKAHLMNWPSIFHSVSSCWATGTKTQGSRFPNAGPFWMVLVQFVNLVLPFNMFFQKHIILL